MNRWVKSARYTCWPVGQGLFTTADIFIEDKLFRIVYDCGTGTKRNSNPSWIRSHRGTPLDLLVISHFDTDHVNGIANLLVETKGATRAWIPHMSPEARWLSSWAMGAGAAGHGWPTAEVANAIEFGATPKRWLTERRAEVVEVIGGGDAGDDEPPPFPSDDQLDEVGNLDLEDIPEGVRLGAARSWSHAFTHESALKCAWAPVHASSGDQEPAALLLSWMKPLTLDDNLDHLRQQILELIGEEALIGNPGEELTPGQARRMAEQLGRCGATSLRDFYRRVDKTLNNSSLFLMVQPNPRVLVQSVPVGMGPASSWRHPTTDFFWDFFPEVAFGHPRLFWQLLCGSGPVAREFRRDRNEWIAMLREFKHMNRHFLEPRRALGAALWSGDADGQVLEELLNDASAQLRHRLEGTWWWAVPHHGSRRSLHQGFYDKLCQAHGYISCGQSNSHGHPSAEVVSRTRAEVVTEYSAPASWGMWWI